MSIISLTCENVKKLRAVTIKPNGESAVIIGGRNGQGKSTVLDAILYALGGASHSPQVPVKIGEDKATIVLETEDLVVQRVYTATGNTYLKVFNRDGGQIKSPQGILDTLTGSLTFDPLKYFKMEARAQVSTLMGFAGLDFTDLEQQKAELTDQRADANRKVKDLESLLANSPNHPDAAKEEVSIKDLVDQQEKFDIEIKENNSLRTKLENKREEVKKKKDLVEELRKEIARLQAALDEELGKLANTEAQIVTMTQEGKALAEQVAGLVDPNIQAVRDQIKNADAINTKVRENKLFDDRMGQFNDAKAEQENLNAALTEIEKQKADRLAAAKFPLAGLSFDENGVLFNNLPLSQASTAEQLRVSVAMGLALNSKLKILLIRDGSSLDEDSLAMVAAMAKEAGAQIWIERVSEGEEVSLIIEDGEIKENRLKEAANG